MCIRDRGGAVPIDLGTEAAIDPYGSRSPYYCVDDNFYDLWVASLAHCMKPVSYTHLRAHETVLDLVCRLLLEKKKTTETEKRLAKSPIHNTVRKISDQLSKRHNR